MFSVYLCAPCEDILKEALVTNGHNGVISHYLRHYMSYCAVSIYEVGTWAPCGYVPSYIRADRSLKAPREVIRCKQIMEKNRLCLEIGMCV